MSPLPCCVAEFNDQRVAMSEGVKPRQGKF